MNDEMKSHINDYANEFYLEVREMLVKRMIKDGFVDNFSTMSIFMLVGFRISFSLLLGAPDSTEARVIKDLVDEAFTSFSQDLDSLID